MSESILLATKKMLGINEVDTTFDSDILIHINSTLMSLYQIGVGSTPYRIKDNTETWTDYLGNRDDLESVKTYIFLKVKLMFDPPTISSVIDSYNRIINEIEWRLNVQTSFIMEE